MKEKNKILLLLAVSGFMTGFTVTFSDYFGAFEWVTMIPLVFALALLTSRDGLKLRHAYAYGLVYFESFYIVCFHWFCELYPLDFTGLDNFTSILVVIIAWFGLSMLQSLFGGICFILFIAVSRTALFKKYTVLRILSFPAIYTFYEFTQTLGWWGVPWGRLSIGQTDSLIPIQTASLFGSYFITFMIVAVNTLIAYALSESDCVKRKRRYAIGALAVYLSNMLLGGALYLIGENSTKDNDSITVGIVQGNYNSTDKWNAAPVEILNTHIELIKKCKADGAEAVVLAETALPFTLYEESKYSKRLSEVAKEEDILIFIGAIEREDGNEYNSIFLYERNGERSETVYRKRHLVPFGEYVPMRAVIDAIVPFLSDISMLDEDVTPGDDPEIFDTELGAFGSLICFDSIYETLARDSVRDGAEILAISTNDSWFGDSRAAYMHTSQAKMRAVELGRYVVRSANTGLSVFISNTGREYGDIEMLERGYSVADVKLNGSRNLYSYIGNLFVYLLGIFIIVPFGFEIYYTLKKRNTDNNTLQNGENNEQKDILQDS